MRTVPLYTGGGVSLSPQHEEGRELSGYARLIADDDKGITDGNIITTCIDVPSADVRNWKDCDMEIMEEAE